MIKNKVLLITLFIICGLITVLWLLTTNRTREEITPQTDQQVLSKWINLNLLPAPTEVKFVQLPLSKGGLAPGPTDYSILAILTYDQPIEKIKSTLSELKPREIYVEESLIKKWLPTSLHSKFVLTPNEHHLYQGQGYETGELLRSPLNTGWILFEGNYVIVMGSTS